MTNYDVLKKLVGRIDPVGDSNVDEERFENLIEMCGILEKIVIDLKSVEHKYKDSKEFSMKRASKYASDFLENLNQ